MKDLLELKFPFWLLLQIVAWNIADGLWEFVLFMALFITVVIIYPLLNELAFSLNLYLRSFSTPHIRSLFLKWVHNNKNGLKLVGVIWGIFLLIAIVWR